MSALKVDSRFVKKKEKIHRVVAVSAAQAEARIHNYTKMIVCAAKANLHIQMHRDVRMNKEQRDLAKYALTFIDMLLKGWE